MLVVFMMMIMFIQIDGRVLRWCHHSTESSSSVLVVLVHQWSQQQQQLHAPHHRHNGTYQSPPTVDRCWHGKQDTARENEWEWRQGTYWVFRVSVFNLARERLLLRRKFSYRIATTTLCDWNYIVVLKFLVSVLLPLYSRLHVGVSASERQYDFIYFSSQTLMSDATSKTTICIIHIWTQNCKCNTDES